MKKENYTLFYSYVEKFKKRKVNEKNFSTLQEAVNFIIKFESENER